jgi:hypothetical protein
MYSPTLIFLWFSFRSLKHCVADNIVDVHRDVHDVFMYRPLDPGDPPGLVRLHVDEGVAPVLHRPQRVHLAVVDRRLCEGGVHPEKRSRRLDQGVGPDNNTNEYQLIRPDPIGGGVQIRAVKGGLNLPVKRTV